MRKESVNSFDGGLVYDLNPLTTPENVLTDCVNGTFLTFNGDELTLQNDAGNTKILVPKIIPEEPDRWVELWEDYYPIGIKEYGGVLYIASAKTNPLVYAATPYDSNATYILGDFVYNNSITVNGVEESSPASTFYQFLSGGGTEDLPLNEDESNSTWSNKGTKADVINGGSRIQFGSYPSPEAGGAMEYEGIPLNIDETTIFDKMLYNTVVLNSRTFKSGRYIQFDDTTASIDSTYISYYDSSGTYYPKFYIPKLQHKLSNGFVDLTDEIWAAYNEYVSGGGYSKKFWFVDGNFKFYCPNLYKGMLTMHFEIEKLLSFEFTEIITVFTLVEETGVEYTISSEMTAENYADVECSAVDVDCTIGKFEQSGTFNIVNGVAAIEFIQFAPGEEYLEGSVISMSAVPRITVGAVDITDDLPTDYIEDYRRDSLESYIP